MALIDDVVTAVDIERLAGDELRRVMREERGGDTHVVDADETAGGCLGLGFVEKCAESGIPDAARVASGPGEMACTRMPFGPSSAAM